MNSEEIIVIINSFEYVFPKNKLMKIPYFEARFSHWSQSPKIKIADSSILPDSLDHIIKYIDDPIPYHNDPIMLSKVLVNADFFSFDLKITRPFELLMTCSDENYSFNMHIFTEESPDEVYITTKFLVFMFVCNINYYALAKFNYILNLGSNSVLIDEVTKMINRFGLLKIIECYADFSNHKIIINPLEKCMAISVINCSPLPPKICNIILRGTSYSTLAKVRNICITEYPSEEYDPIIKYGHDVIEPIIRSICDGRNGQLNLPKDTFYLNCNILSNNCNILSNNFY